MNTALKQYEINHPNIVIDKSRTVCKNDFEWGEQYILLITDPDDATNPDINQVIYQGKQPVMSSFRLDTENPGDVIRNEGEIDFAFRTLSKPNRFFSILLSDIDVDCFFYKMTTR